MPALELIAVQAGGNIAVFTLAYRSPHGVHSRGGAVTSSSHSVNLSLKSPVREIRTLGSVGVGLPEEGSPSTRTSGCNPPGLLAYHRFFTIPGSVPGSRKDRPAGGVDHQGVIRLQIDEGYAPTNRRSVPPRLRWASSRRCRIVSLPCLP